MPTVVLGISGSIAAYKAVEVARLLIKAGVRVVPVMTRAATRMVGEATFAGICGERVRVEMFDPSVAGELHVQLAAEADVVAVVPATADLLACMAHGRAADLLRATLLCTAAPMIVAPAMHPRMWQNPATQRNVRLLADDARVVLVGPVDGEVASGETGMGRMAEPEAIAAEILAHLGPRDLLGRRIVVTAGPTVEDIDPARYLSNRSSGRMGFAIAERAAARGAEVVLIAGPVSLPTPHGCRRVDVRGALDMKAAIDEHLAGADTLVMCAAVADYRPAHAATEKIKRGERQGLDLELVQNPDLLADIGHARDGKRPLLVGFALETVPADRLAEVARAKLRQKRVDLVVANRADDGFDKDDNVITLVTETHAERLPRASKSALADRILDRIASWPS